MMSGPVLLFDSGVGGLSVVSALRQHYPRLPMCYACDNAWLPYGLRDDVTLSKRIVAVCKAAVDACQASVLVVACNTASTLALEGLRQTLDIPVVGTVPAIKPAARSSLTRHIGLLATTATVNRPYTQALINSFASDCIVTKVAADALVTQAELWLSGVPLDEQGVQQALSPLWQATQHTPALDTVVLGCTHFPLLKPMLVSLSPKPLIWVDSGDAIARRVGQVAPNRMNATPDGRCFTTAPAAQLTIGLSRYGFQPPQLLTVSDTGR